MADVALGTMVLYDFMVPPLVDGSYRMSVSTDVTLEGTPQPLDARQSFFSVDGPRFTLSPTEVAGVFPPRNGHGPFDNAIPHVALYRRTLPWERALDPQNLIGNVDKPVLGQQPTHDTGLPWMAVLLFEESEVTLLKNQPLEEVVPAAVFQRLGRPAGMRCDAIEADFTLVSTILPSKEELQLLAHVRQVNVEDRELAAGDSDGYFAVVMGSRLPSPGIKYVACLVSLEERSDLVAKNPPPQAHRLSSVFPGGVEQVALADVPFAAQPDHALAAAGAKVVSAGEFLPGKIRDQSIFRPRTRLVCLYSWRFECEGTGTFRALMQRLDVGMIGKVASVGAPALTDTAHLKLNLQNRAGVPEQVLYRGPLVPFPLTRDTLGPYHCADQARRVAPDAGGEDVSYAAAFEVGRLLAAADSRLGQELMRWRRGAYRRSVAKDAIKDLVTKFGMVLPDAHAPLPPYVALHAVEEIARNPVPQADVFGLNKIASVPGLNPTEVQKTFGLETVQQAINLLGGNPGTLGTTVHAPPALAAGPQSIDEVVRDTPGLERLADARTDLLNNVNVKLGGKP
jgi:hypothetical protein